MIGNTVLGIIYSNSYDSSVGELTGQRTMGSVPFAARYRLIDFVLSGMVNCGIGKVGVITKSNYRSLMDHIGSGRAWDLARKREGLTILPPYNLQGSGGMYSGRVDALKSNMDYVSHSKKEYVLLTDCNVVYNPDYEKMIETHIESGADITVAYKHGVLPKLPDTMAFALEGDKIKGVTVSPVTEDEVDFSLNMIIMKRVLLERLINAAISTGDVSFERDIILANVDSLDIRGYKVDSFAEVIDSLQKYYDVSMSLVDDKYRALFDPQRRVFTKVRDDMPAIYGINSDVKNTLVADGCIIKGKVENCILFRGVRIEEGAVIKNSVIMQDTYISADAKINCAILDKGVVVTPGRELSGAPSYPLYIGKKIIV